MEMRRLGSSVAGVRLSRRLLEVVSSHPLSTYVERGQLAANETASKVENTLNRHGHRYGHVCLPKRVFNDLFCPEISPTAFVTTYLPGKRNRYEYVSTSLRLLNEATSNVKIDAVFGASRREANPQRLGLINLTIEGDLESRRAALRGYGSDVGAAANLTSLSLRIGRCYGLAGSRGNKRASGISAGPSNSNRENVGYSYSSAEGSSASQEAALNVNTALVETQCSCSKQDNAIGDLVGSDPWRHYLQTFHAITESRSERTQHESSSDQRVRLLLSRTRTRLHRSARASDDEVSSRKSVLSTMPKLQASNPFSVVR
jgi:hypothetical protein